MDMDQVKAIASVDQFESKLLDLMDEVGINEYLAYTQVAAESLSDPLKVILMYGAVKSVSLYWEKENANNNN